MGNHEVGNEFDSLTGAPMVNYVHRYFMPGNYSSPRALQPYQYNKSAPYYGFDVEYLGGSSYYAVQQGLITMISLNTYNGHNYGPDSPMFQWFEQTMKEVNRTLTPWVVVSMHAPWYNTNSGHLNPGEEDTDYMRAAYEPLFNKYKVNFVFAGHVHAYERFMPTGLNATCDPNDMTSGPTYITVGDGGNHEQLYLPEVLADWDQLHCSAYRNNEYYGFGFLKIFNRTTAEWVWVPNPEGSERIPAEYHEQKTAHLARMDRGFVDQVIVGNYALGDDEIDMTKFHANQHV